MARQTRRRYVRQMPKVYGNLHKPKRSFAWLAKFLRRLSFTALSLAILYALFFGPFFRVHKVEVEGAILSNSDTIAQAVPLNSSIWFLPKQRILQTIAHNPLVTGVDILRGIPDSVRLVVTEREPTLLWSSNASVYLVDDQGVPFTSYTTATLPELTTPAGKKIASLLTVIDTKNLAVTLGQPVVGTKFMAFAQALQTDMTQYLPILHSDHAEVADTTYDLTLATKEGMQVEFNTQGDAGIQVRNLTRLIQQAKLNTKTAFVDLRVNRWAYVH